MDEALEDEEELENFAFCPHCDEETAHAILRSKEKGKGIDHLVQCSECNNVQTIQLRPPKSKEIRFTLSEMHNSRQVRIEIDVDEMFSLGDTFEYEDAVWEITRLEMPDANSAKRVSVDDVLMVWAARRDMVMVRLTFTEGEYSFSDSIMCDPDKQFTCGAIYEHSGEKWRIRALHSGKRRTLNGKMKATDIRRVFLHLPPTDEDRQAEARIERGKWKGQNFRGRDEHQEKVKTENIHSKRKYQSHKYK
ncbi:MAG: hypothetical protein HOE69_04445 [Euryarchaeota archaeon]|jgi:uncharacterized Zn finger protein|nr:hypothetical protein [Euryarchaeota archaeon]